MQQIDFDEVLTKITQKDPRYHSDAYYFLKEGLDFAQKTICKANKSQARHISGQELLEGIRQYSLNQFGPMSKTVLNEWGINNCEDFGNMVFHMVEHGLLSKTNNDKREDFEGGYDFCDAFERPFQPSRPRSIAPKPDNAETPRS